MHKLKSQTETSAVIVKNNSKQNKFERYEKPRWMLNDSITDYKWFIARNGMDIPTSKPFPKESYRILSFNKEIAPDDLLTSKANRYLLTDIKNSLLYLSIIEKVSRPQRFIEIVETIVNLIKHTNELRTSAGKPHIRRLSMIRFNDLNNYLESFQISYDLYSKALKIISSQKNYPEKKEWLQIKNTLSITSRELTTLKNKIRNYLNSQAENKASHYTAEYCNACQPHFDTENALKPKQKTIYNAISNLEMLYASRIAQEFPFPHSSRELFSDGIAIFDDTTAPNKTKLIPSNVALHSISQALHFVKNYGLELRSFIQALTDSEKVAIQELKIVPSKVVRTTKAIRSYAFNNTRMPNAIKKLKITTWEYDTPFENLKHDWVRDNLSVGAAILLYIASMWILLGSFTAGRKLSLNTLKRNCFSQSPIDGLFDITLRIPKSSERLELEDVHRPIPDLIFDYGIEFSLFVSQLEERQGYFLNEEDVYLFGKVLSLNSSSAFNHNSKIEKTDFYKYPLSGDTIYKALCFFQDWSQSPLIDNKRWYPSSHQFRRLFAVLYFNFSDDQGLEELSWFMGHSSLEQTYHYAEILPNDDWIEEAEITIAKIGATLSKFILADKAITKLVNKARKSSETILVLEPLIRKLIDDHKLKTGEEVRFKKIDGNDIFFYFCTPGGKK